MNTMHVDVVTLTAVILCFPLLTLCDPLYVLSAPNLLRVGSPENVFVEAQDYSGGNLNVRITVKNHPKKNLEILSKSVTLTADNNFQILTDIKIPDDQKFFSDDPLEKQYVYLQAQFPSVTLEKVVMVSFQMGYIFVQTDKPIYTPASTVNYRIFSLTPDQQPFDGVSISVDIMNPQGITLDRDQFQPRRGIRTETFALPELTSFGIWKLIAKYTNTPQKNFTTEFEVMEYVLPSFEVTLNPRKPFFYVDERSLTVDISAKYLFGNKVRGTAFVVFGVIDNEKKISIAASLQKIQIIDGEGVAELTRQMIMGNFPDIQQLVGKSLYISASVLTETGSEMVEADKKGIQIVTSPYTIHFKKTPHFFKPGMPFDVSVYVTNPDQTPAKNVEVEVNPGGVKGRTRDNGIAKVTVNTPGGTSTLEITAKTKDPQLSDEQQAVKKMTAQAYKPKGGSNNYLHIGIDAAELQIGDQMKVSLNLGNSPGVKNQDFTYMILSKGQIVQVDRFKMKGQSLVSLSLPVTKDMLPSFRFVAYYHVGSSEVVSDSVWIDMKDTCMGTLKVEVKDPTQYGPGDQLSLKITGDPGAKVGLVAVDKGVYVLNNKNRLTQTKIWDVIEKHDTGCTAGGGRDNMGVFTDAGLMFESNTAGGTNTRTNNECPVPSKRKRRAESLLQVTTTLAGQYSGEQKMCCVDGFQENKLGYSCERRASFIVDGDECVKAFLHCCNEMKRRSDDFGEKEFILARSEEDDFDEELGDVMIRTQFPESWLWEEIDLPPCPANKLCAETSTLRTGIFLKDSITTWQITAISLSKTLGICVADPYEITVRKDFFIDLKMPYSVVRNEQLEIKAVLHNYSNQKLKTYIRFKTSEGICSSASKKQKGRITVSVGPMSSIAIPLIIIPMELKEQWIEAEAYSSNRNDAIRKNLKVVPQGVLTEVREKIVQINPSEHPGGSQVVSMRSDIPRRKVPNTPASTVITVIGEEMTLTIEQAISGNFMGQLIVQPSGCGEQNMIYVTLPLIATHYLDSTKQWEAVGMERRNEAVNHIRTGYQQELAFRKTDGSYGAWLTVPSSTWLTAYVAKVFAMASDLIVIEENVICSALNWLATKKQLPDGTFKEDAPAYHSEMVGNVRGKDADASLTAFILIAMQEGSKICAGSNLQNSMKRAIDYLLLRVHSLTSTYAVAMTSYALAHAGKLNKDILKSFSTQSKDGIFWQVPGQHYHSLEATGYAVLALVMAKDFESAGLAVRWLGRQQSRYGGYGTTQATIMVFQAVAEYRVQVKKADIKLDLELAVQERKEKSRIAIRVSNVALARSDKFDITKSFNITAQGTGVAMLLVFSVYYALPEEKDYVCNAYELSVQMEKESAVSYDGASESYQITIEYIFKDQLRSSTMSILDIGLLTGFKVDERDLSKLSSGKDKYIQSFELNKELSERGSLIIYIDKVSNKEKERLVFRMHKINEVGMLQPAGVTVYEYNAPDKRCVRFYHPYKKDGSLNRLCHEDLCQCAEENCSLQKNERIDEDKREDKACEREVEYVYKTRVLEMDFSLYADIYNMTVEQVLKEGSDPGVEGNMRSFLAHPFCRDFLKFEKGKTYLIMGQTKTLPRIGGKLRYNFGEDTWIEYWPTNEEGQTPKYRAKYIGITSLANKLSRFGCST
ncbi:complement C3-like isoform X3 [Cyprinus carpio]|uniref:Complement C3-like isoform X3 n=1 Tax=Cyprinus carpio TaxID=7962 RepID=A0A9Q9ZTA4_CYPCA|nr:complement C3-like isoform X3 [Cyprinus carpio]